MKNDVHDLGVLLDAQARLIVIESWEEQRVLETVGMLAVRRNLTWYTWNLVDGMSRLGFGSDPEPADPSECAAEQALTQLRRDALPGLYVFCDLHPFLDSPRVVRLLKMLAMDEGERAPTLILLSHEFRLPAELSRLAARLTLNMPSTEQLRNIVREEASRWSARNNGLKVRTDNRTLEQVVQNLRGLSHAEARRLARNLIVNDGAITQDDLPQLNKARFELLGMQGALSFEQDTARFADVGGLQQFKRWLGERQQAFLDESLRDAPRGVLLAGVQGSGKSLAARAVAGLWGLPLLRLDFATLYNKYIGETEKNLRQALELADAMQPCVLWIDEIEKGLAEDGSDTGVSRRLLGTLLTWMAERKSRVFLVATANEVQRLPPELIRKGRLDEMFFVDLPTAGVREEILCIHLRQRELDPSLFDLAGLAQACHGFAGAEIEQAVVSAIYSASARQQAVSDAHLYEAISTTSPLSVVMAERLQALRDWAAGRAVMAD